MQRNYSIDILKAVAALLVICIHTGYPSVLGDYLVAFCRISVPLFLLISGYYYQVIIDRKKITNYIKKILSLTFFSSIFYFIVFDKKLDYLIVFRWDKMFIFSFPIAGDHLWYLFSLINVLVILTVCNKIILSNTIFVGWKLYFKFFSEVLVISKFFIYFIAIFLTRNVYL